MGRILEMKVGESEKGVGESRNGKEEGWKGKIYVY